MAYGRLERRLRSDDDLVARATKLNNLYFGGLAVPASVRWVGNQNARWGSCTPGDRTIRLSDRLQQANGVQTMDIAKRLLDYGFYAPTIYFPLVVKGALMIEPTETESRETLDEFIAAMRAIAEEARTQPDLVRAAPHTTRVGRLDETRAARRPVLRWKPGVQAPAPAKEN